MATSADSGVLGSAAQRVLFLAGAGGGGTACGYAARADSLRQAANDSPEVIEALFPANFASGVDVDVGVGLSRQIRLVARVTNEAGADPWWRCICGNDPEYEGFSPSDANGTLQVVEGGGPSAAWDGRHYCCNSCGAYFARSNLASSTWPRGPACGYQ